MLDCEDCMDLSKQQLEDIESGTSNFKKSLFDDDVKLDGELAKNIMSEE